MGGDKEEPTTPAASASSVSAQSAKEAVSSVLKSIQAVEDEGTPLRGVIGTARQGLNRTLNDVRAKVYETRSLATESIDSVTLGRKDDIKKVADFGKKHPEVMVGAAALLVGIPTAFVSKRKALVSAVVAGGGTYAFFSLSHFWQNRKGGSSLGSGGASTSP